MEKSKWVISQKWEHLVFLNYFTEPENVKKFLPKGIDLDLFEGKAYLTIVPFRMSRVRFPWTPYIPFSGLWELNIRTYVEVNGVKGIYFFTLDTNHYLAALIARKFFYLPYRSIKFYGNSIDKNLNYTSPSFKLSGEVGERKSKNNFERWICERYHLFTTKNDKIYQGTAVHDPWEVHDFKIKHLDSSFLESFDFKNCHFENAFSGGELEVKFKPFEEL